jgi:hypothetical protein
MRTRFLIGVLELFLAGIAAAQQPLTMSDKESLPSASLWKNYSYDLRVSDGVPPYHWVLLSGSLPRGFRLTESGEVTGTPEEATQVEFTALVRDSNNPPRQQEKKFVLTIEPPLTAEWNHTVRVNGKRIDGSIKVSNRTGRDFDLTVIVLAVNDIGRATAIGYQHFPLKEETRDFDIPFGDTISRGMYVVNVDVVGEEQISTRIFRSRLVVGNQQVTEGP